MVLDPPLTSGFFVLARVLQQYPNIWMHICIKKDFWYDNKIREGLYGALFDEIDMRIIMVSRELFLQQGDRTDGDEGYCGNGPVSAGGRFIGVSPVRMISRFM